MLCEAVSNPLIKVADIPALVRMAHDVGAALLVDASFATSLPAAALAHGADYSIHSATKYLGGHGDVMAGVVSCSAERAHDLRERQKALGRQPGSPGGLAGLARAQDLALRMRQHCANAQVVAAVAGPASMLNE